MPFNHLGPYTQIDPGAYGIILHRYTSYELILFILFKLNEQGLRESRLMNFTSIESIELDTQSILEFLDIASKCHCCDYHKVNKPSRCALFCDNKNHARPNMQTTCICFCQRDALYFVSRLLNFRD